MYLPIMQSAEGRKTRVANLEDLETQLRATTLKPTKTSWFLDQIAGMTPEEVRISFLLLGPDEDDFKAAKAEQKEGFNLILQGTCRSSSPVARFSGGLEAAPFVKQIEILESEYSYTGEEFEFTFMLEVSDAG